MAKPNVITKDKLISFAKTCLVETGIEKFTLRAVAEMAGVSQGTVYYHFRTKEQLLLDIVDDMCKTSWEDISRNKDTIKQAFESAKSRCLYDSFFHRLFFTLASASFNNEKIREQLGGILSTENRALSENLSKVWTESPIDGVSMDTWGILFNAIVDGLAVQSLLQKDFHVEKTYTEFEKLFKGLSNFQKEEK